MEQITGYAIIGAIVVGLVVLAGYLRASKNEKAEVILKIEEDKPNPPTELKFEVVKAAPPVAKKPAVKKPAVKKTAAKKTAAKKPAAKKAVKTTTIKNP